MECRAYCSARRYDLLRLGGAFKERNLKPFVSREVVYFKEEKSGGWVFLFDYGVAVFWASQIESEEYYLEMIKAFEQGSLKEVVSDDFTYRTGDEFKIEDEEIVFSGDKVEDKLAVSHALAQSVKLEVFELIIEETLEKSQHLVKDLAQTGKIPFNRRQIAKKMGQIMLQRNEVNLHCDVLDTPDLFWNSGDLEVLYEATLGYLDLQTRSGVLTRRMDAIKEILEILSDELHQQHFAFLEWIIIILILIEVLFSLFVHLQSHRAVL